MSVLKMNWEPMKLVMLSSVVSDPLCIVARSWSWMKPCQTCSIYIHMLEPAMLLENT